MKRVLQFKQTEAGYGCYEEDEVIFEIKKADLQFNVKDFYLAFYAEDKNFEDIHIENTLTADKDATRVYNCIKTIIDQIAEKMAELLDKDDAKNLPDDENESDVDFGE